MMTGREITAISERAIRVALAAEIAIATTTTETTGAEHDESETTTAT